MAHEPSSQVDSAARPGGMPHRLPTSARLAVHGGHAQGPPPSHRKPRELARRHVQNAAPGWESDNERTGEAKNDASRESEAMARPRALSLRWNYAWTFFGNVAYAACQWAMLTVLAKTGSAEVVGLFVLALSVTAPLMLAGFCQLRSVIVQDQASEQSAGDYFCFWTLSGLLCLVVTGFVGISGYGGYVATIFVAMGAVRLIEFHGEIVHGYFQKHEAMHYVTWFRVVQGLAGLAAFATAMLVGGGLLLALGALFVTRLALLVFLELRDFRRRCGVEWHVFPRRGGVQRLVLLVIPLGGATLLTALGASYPRLVLEHHGGLDLLAYFGAASYVVLVSNTVIQALATVILPRLTRHAARRESADFHALLWKSTALGAAIGIAAIAVGLVAGKQLLTWLYTSDYAAYSNVFVILVSATIFSNVAFFQRSAILAIGAFRSQLALDAAVLGSVVVTSAWLIPSEGLIGAAKVVVISQVVNAVGAAAVVFVLAPRRLRRSWPSPAGALT